MLWSRLYLPRVKTLAVSFLVSEAWNKLPLHVGLLYTVCRSALPLPAILKNQNADLTYI